LNLPPDGFFGSLERPRHFWDLGGTTEQLAEKVQSSPQNPRSVPQGLKPRIDSMDMAPGIKSPGYRPNEFFRKL
jgi:hypothetical protein